MLARPVRWGLTGNLIDARAWWPVAAFSDHRLDIGRRTDEQSLDAAVGAVAHPARQTQSGRLGDRPSAKPNALNPSINSDLNSRWLSFAHAGGIYSNSRMV